MNSLCFIRPAESNEKGEWIVVVDGLSLTLGWLDLAEAMRFCRIVLGASSYSFDGTVYRIGRFDHQRKYRVPNHWSLDDALKGKMYEKPDA